MGRLTQYSSITGQGPVAGCCEHGNEPSDFIWGIFSLDKKLLASQGLRSTELVS
jgi:hypothetical protein